MVFKSTVLAGAWTKAFARERYKLASGGELKSRTISGEAVGNRGGVHRIPFVDCMSDVLYVATEPSLSQ